MGRVINPNTAGKQRTQLIRVSAIANRELLAKNRLDREARDIAAFLSFTLAAIYSSIEPTVQAWEKRDYWVKADRYRHEWQWADELGKNMSRAILAEDWKAVQDLAGKIQIKLAGEKISAAHRQGTPWVGAWEKLQNTKNS